MATVTVKVAVTTEDAEVAREVAEVKAEVKAEGEAQEEAESEVAITINLAAVLTYKVLTAKSKADVVFTSMWLLGGIFFSGAAVIALLALGVALEWPHCFHENSHDSCSTGQVCVSYPEPGIGLPDYRNGHEGFQEPVCQDCYWFAKVSPLPRTWPSCPCTLASPQLYLHAPTPRTPSFTSTRPPSSHPISQTNGTISLPDDLLLTDPVPVGMLFGTGDNTTASEFCLEALNEHGSAFEFATSRQNRAISRLFPSPGALGPRSSFARCLYIQETLGKESDLDSFILLVVFVLVALSMAEDQRQQQLMCRLRRILLPLQLRPKKKTTGSVLRWLGILLLTINEFVISLVAPMLPFGVVFLMLTQGAL